MDHILQLLLGPGSTLVFVLFVLYTGWKGLWVYGPAYDKLEKEKDEWKTAAIRGYQAAATAADLASSIHQEVQSHDPK